MAFIITRDLNAERYPNCEISQSCNRKGVIGPSGVNPDIQARLQSGEGMKFKMICDEGIVHFHGRYIEDSPESDQLEPLDCLGAPDVGCTEIHYLQEDGVWREI